MVFQDLPVLPACHDRISSQRSIPPTAHRTSVPAEERSHPPSTPGLPAQFPCQARAIHASLKAPSHARPSRPRATTFSHRTSLFQITMTCLSSSSTSKLRAPIPSQHVQIRTGTVDKFFDHQNQYTKPDRSINLEARQAALVRQ